MTIRELAEKLPARVLAGEEGLDRSFEGCYVGDLLSWVMGRAAAGDVWITVMGNVNAIAVAALADCACIVLAESASLDAEAAARANQQGIPVLASEDNRFRLAVRTAGLLPK